MSRWTSPSSVVYDLLLVRFVGIVPVNPEEFVTRWSLSRRPLAAVISPASISPVSDCRAQILEHFLVVLKSRIYDPVAVMRLSAPTLKLGDPLRDPLKLHHFLFHERQPSHGKGVKVYILQVVQPAFAFAEGWGLPVQSLEDRTLSRGCSRGS